MKNFKSETINQIAAIKEYITIYKYNDYQTDIQLLEKLEESVASRPWLSLKAYSVYDSILKSIDFRIQRKMNCQISKTKTIR